MVLFVLLNRFLLLLVGKWCLMFVFVCWLILVILCGWKICVIWWFGVLCRLLDWVLLIFWLIVMVWWWMIVCGRLCCWNWFIWFCCISICWVLCLVLKGVLNCCVVLVRLVVGLLRMIMIVNLIMFVWVVFCCWWFRGWVLRCWWFMLVFLVSCFIWGCGWFIWWCCSGW